MALNNLDQMSLMCLQILLRSLSFVTVILKKEKITQKYVVAVGLFLGSFMSLFFLNRTVKLKSYQACWIINDTGPRGELRRPPSSRSGEAGAGLSSRGRRSPGSLPVCFAGYRFAANLTGSQLHCPPVSFCCSVFEAMTAFLGV